MQNYAWVKTNIAFYIKVFFIMFFQILIMCEESKGFSLYFAVMFTIYYVVHCQFIQVFQNLKLGKFMVE